MRKSAARAGLRMIRSMVGQGNVAGAERLALTPGVLKKTMAGSQVAHLGSGMEGVSTLVAHPKRGLEVRKMIDPKGVAGPGMVQAREAAGTALRDSTDVAQFHGAYNTPGGLRAQRFEYVPGGRVTQGRVPGAPTPPPRMAAGTPQTGGVSTSAPSFTPEQRVQAQLKRVQMQGAQKGFVGPRDRVTGEVTPGIRDLHAANVVGQPGQAGKVVDFAAVPPPGTTKGPYLNPANAEQAFAAQNAAATGGHTPYLDYLNDPRRPGNIMAQAFRKAPPLIPGSSTQIANTRRAAEEARTVAQNRQTAQSIMAGVKMALDRNVLAAFAKEAAWLFDEYDAPPDYYATKEAILSEFPKLAWDWSQFREGLADEGVPLGGAAIGATLSKNSLRGAALGYAAGGGLSLLRSKLKGEKPSLARKLLAASALGYGAGGGLHAVTEHMLKNKAGVAPWFTEATKRGRFLSEALPAAGATLATGLAMGSYRDAQHPHPSAQSQRPVTEQLP